MKRTLTILAAVLLLFAFTACGAEQKEDTQTQTVQTEEPENVQTQTAQAEEPQEEQAETKTGTVKVEGSTITITDDGSGKATHEGGIKKTPIVTNKSIDASGQVGPIKFKITGAQLSKCVADSDQGAKLFGVEKGKEFAIVGIEMEVENTVDDEVDFFPNQGTIVTNLKEQVDAALFFSDDIGGQFLGKVKKSGQTYFICKNSVPDEITSVRYHANGPLNVTTTDISDALNITINFDR